MNYAPLGWCCVSGTQKSRLPDVGWRLITSFVALVGAGNSYVMATTGSRLPRYQLLSKLPDWRSSFWWLGVEGMGFWTNGRVVTAAGRMPATRDTRCPCMVAMFLVTMVSLSLRCWCRPCCLSASLGQLWCRFGCRLFGAGQVCLRERGRATHFGVSFLRRFHQHNRCADFVSTRMMLACRAVSFWAFRGST